MGKEEFEASKESSESRSFNEFQQDSKDSNRIQTKSKKDSKRIETGMKEIVRQE